MQLFGEEMILKILTVKKHVLTFGIPRMTKDRTIMKRKSTTRHRKTMKNEVTSFHAITTLCVCECYVTFKKTGCGCRTLALLPLFVSRGMFRHVLA